MVTLDEERMTTLVKGVKELHASLVEQHHGLGVPLEVFLQPCEVIV